MAEMPDRHKVNMEIDRIISRHRNDAGHIPAMNVADLRRDLKHHMDESVAAALDYGTEIGRTAAKEA